jgi:ribonuclease BN (tRNA processing enzyme)
MKIYFLGTNGWYDTDCGNTICTLIVANKYNLILDAGNGIYKADKYINKNNPVYLFLSHFHIDHIEGLHILEKFNDSFNSLNIYGQPGTTKIVNDFLGNKFSVPLSKLRFKSKIIELKQGFHNVPFKIQCLKLDHSASCYGYRMEVDNKVISYCTDTGYCKNAVKLSKDADLLISECALKSGQANPKWPHLNPELAAKIAVEAKVKKLALTHFDANVYKTIKEREMSEKISNMLFPVSIAALDGMKINI